MAISMSAVEASLIRQGELCLRDMREIEKKDLIRLVTTLSIEASLA